MNIIVHRGSHQIGGSCVEVFSNSTRIIIDIGETLPSLEDNDQKIVSIPKVEGLFKNHKRTIDGILISHGHGDHIGLIKNIHQGIPVYIGEKALKIYDMTLKFTGEDKIPNPVFYFQSGKEIVIGDLVITPYLVDHSGFDAYAFLIKHGNKCMVYTGDFRCHGRKKNATKYFIDSIPKNIDLLMVEGTMISRIQEKVDTEFEIEKKAYTFMISHNTPVYVLQSSTNIDRLVGMYRAAKRSGRLFVMDIFTANIVSQLSDNIPKPGKFKDIRVFYPYHLTKKMFERADREILMRQFSRYCITKEQLDKRDDYCMLIRSTMLSDLRHIENLKNAGLIYSMWGGYKKQKSISNVLDYANMVSMDVIELHTSGHACIESINEIINSSRAKKIIPVHTENPKLFADKFQNIYIAEDGEVISI